MRAYTAGIKCFAQSSLRQPPVPLADTAALAAFETAQIPASPYAVAVDPDGSVTGGLVENDPYKGLAPSPLIPDESWVALQGICSA